MNLSFQQVDLFRQKIISVSISVIQLDELNLSCPSLFHLVFRQSIGVFSLTHCSICWTQLFSLWNLQSISLVPRHGSQTILTSIAHLLRALLILCFTQSDSEFSAWNYLTIWLIDQCEKKTASIFTDLSALDWWVLWHHAEILNTWFRALLVFVINTNFFYQTPYSFCRIQQIFFWTPKFHPWVFLLDQQIVLVFLLHPSRFLIVSYYQILCHLVFFWMIRDHLLILNFHLLIVLSFLEHFSFRKLTLNDPYWFSHIWSPPHAVFFSNPNSQH